MLLTFLSVFFHPSFSMTGQILREDRPPACICSKSIQVTICGGFNPTGHLGQMHQVWGHVPPQRRLLVSKSPVRVCSIIPLRQLFCQSYICLKNIVLSSACILLLVLSCWFQFYFSKCLSQNAFLFPFIFWGLLLSVLFIIMNTSLPHFSLVSSLFQDGFCEVLLPSKILHPLPKVFIAACFPSCHFILVAQVRGKIRYVCYAGQNHFTFWCGALLCLYPFSSHFCIKLSVITWHCNFNFLSFGRHRC